MSKRTAPSRVLGSSNTSTQHLNITRFEHVLAATFALVLCALTFAQLTSDFVYAPADEAIFPAGDSGAWDARYTYSPYIIQHDGTYYMYYGGISQTNVWAFGLATSSDGINWQRRFVDAPMFTPNTGVKPTTPVVLLEADTWIMYYVDWQPDGASNLIYRATAPAAAGPWTADPEPVITAPPDSWQSIITLRDVILTDNGYLMMYSGANSSGTHYQIGVATSNDGLTWTLSDDPVIARNDADDRAWDHSAIVPSNILQQADGSLAIFTMGTNTVFRNFPYSTPVGYATSQDGLNWTPSNSGQPIIETDDEPFWSFLYALPLDDEVVLYLPWDAGAKGMRIMRGPRP
ncbi:MAG: hypothetical protein AAF708_19315 [Deinococcota bacterium]